MASITAEEAAQAIIELRAQHVAMSNAMADLRSQNTRLAAAHEQAHRDLTHLRDTVMRPGRTTSLVDPRVMIPSKFGTKGPHSQEWRDWSYEARHYIARVDANLPGILQTIETRKEPILPTEVRT